MDDLPGLAVTKQTADMADKVDGLALEVGVKESTDGDLVSDAPKKAANMVSPFPFLHNLADELITDEERRQKEVVHRTAQIIQARLRRHQARKVMLVKKYLAKKAAAAAERDQGARERKDGIAGTKSVPVEGMVMLLEKREAYKSVIAQLMLGLMFFTGWIVFCVDYSDAHAAFATEKPMRSFATSAAGAVTDKASWYRFLESSLVPSFFTATDYNGNTLSGTHPNFGEFSEFYK